MTATPERLGELAEKYEQAAMHIITLQAESTGSFRPGEILDIATRAAPAFAVAAALRARIAQGGDNE